MVVRLRMAFMVVDSLSECGLGRAQVYTVMLAEMVRQADKPQDMLSEAKSHGRFSTNSPAP